MANLTDILIDTGLRCLAILVVAGLVAACLRRASAAIRHLVWSLAVIGVLALPVLAAVLPGWGVLPRLADGAAVATGSVAPQSREVASEGEPRPDAAASAQVGPSAQPRRMTIPPPTRDAVLAGSQIASRQPRALQPTQPVGNESAAEDARRRAGRWGWVPWLWLAGAAVAFVPLVLGALSLCRLRRTCKRVGDNACLSLLERAKSELGLRRRIELLKSPSRTMPLTWGITKARVLLPEGAESWSEDRLHAVLLHELAHVKRRDCLTQLLSRIASGLYWYNPLIWLAAHRMTVERERACDDLVLACGTRGSVYAEHLLSLAAGPRAARCIALAGIAMARKSGIEHRVLAILDATRNRRGLGRLGGILAVLALTAVVVPVALVEANRSRALSSTEESGEGAASGLEVELVSVRPNGADEVFAPNGESLGERPDYVFGRAVWNADERYLQFNFEYTVEHPHPAGPPLFTPFLEVRPVGLGRGVGSGQSYRFGKVGNRGRYVVDFTSYDPDFRESKRVDVVVRYWYGPRREAAYTFEGTFEIGKTIQPTNGKPLRLKTLEYDPDWGTRLELTTDQPFEIDRNRFLFYDRKGRRRWLHGVEGSSGDNGAKLSLIVQDTRPEQIEAITVEEPVYSKTFAGVVIQWLPDHPHRTDAPWLDRLADALEAPGLPQDVADGGPWTEALTGPREALRVAHLVRGPGMRDLWHFLRHGEQRLGSGFDAAELPDDLAERLRKLFMAWHDQQRLAVRHPGKPGGVVTGAYGLALGLFMDWPEFVDPALELAERDVEFSDTSPVSALKDYDGPLTDRQFQRIRRLLLDRRDAHVHQHLFRVLQQHREDEAARRALVALALENARPWVWWNALVHARAHETFSPEQRDSERFRKRMILVHSPSWTSSDRPELRDEAWAMLPSIVSDPTMLRVNTSGWRKARKLLEEHLPKDEATAAEVELLRRLDGYHEHWWAVLEIARSINRRHGMDLAGVGNREGHDYEEQREHNWSEVAEKVIAWHEKRSADDFPQPDENEAD